MESLLVILGCLTPYHITDAESMLGYSRRQAGDKILPSFTKSLSPLGLHPGKIALSGREREKIMGTKWLHASTQQPAHFCPSKRRHDAVTPSAAGGSRHDIAPRTNQETAGNQASLERSNRKKRSVRWHDRCQVPPRLSRKGPSPSRSLARSVPGPGRESPAPQGLILHDAAHSISLSLSPRGRTAAIADLGKYGRNEARLGVIN